MVDKKPRKIRNFYEERTVSQWINRHMGLVLPQLKLDHNNPYHSLAFGRISCEIGLCQENLKSWTKYQQRLVLEKRLVSPHENETVYVDKLGLI